MQQPSQQQSHGVIYLRREISVGLAYAGIRRTAGAVLRRGGCVAGRYGLAVVLMAAASTGRAARAEQQAPIPDVPTLLAQCLQHQKQLEAVQENYTFHEVVVTRELNKNGSLKKAESEEYEIFFVNTHEVRRLMKKDGRELTSDEDRKEQERVMKAVEKAQRTPPGQSPQGNVVLSVSHILSMARVSAPRREVIDGRRNIAFDFAGDPKAKAHGIAEEAAKRMSGSVWIDEQDREVRRMIARLDDNLHVGFGLFSLGKGSDLSFDQKLINNELWLPTAATVHASGHAIGVFGFRADVEITDNDYKRFHAEAVQTGAAAIGSAKQ